MSLRMEFVERAKAGEKMAALCREFGISRTTGHKWRKRFETSGYEGLEEESRQPKASPLATAEQLVTAVLDARLKYPRWGARKIQGMLQRKFGEGAPSERTVARILRRAELVRTRRIRRRPNVVDRAPDAEALKCNDIWTVDFKGWWRTRDGQRCDPLTVRDAYSRYVLTVRLCQPTTREVREVFERLFTRHGVPGAIQCDNGAPFVSVRSRAGISSLSAWWMSLGIRLVRSRPGKPQDNGGHERMHLDIAAEVQTAPAATREEQQRALDRWRQQFNSVRPHEALQGKTPAEVYKPTERRKVIARDFAYPSHLLVTRVHRSGSFAWQGAAYDLGIPFREMKVGLEQVDPMHVRVWFRDQDLGLVEVVPHASAATYEEASRSIRSKG